MLVRNILWVVAALALTGAVLSFLWTGPAPDGPPGYTVRLATGSFAAPADRRPVPNLALAGADGPATSLAALRGKVVLVNLWATWCSPCVREMPALDALQKALGGPGFQVAAVSEDRGGAPVVAAFLAERKLAGLPTYLDPTGDAARQLAARGLPTSVLVDAQGREVMRLEGGTDWAAAGMIDKIRAVMAESGS